MSGTGGAYGRIEATPTTLTYTRVANNGGKITDKWTITQHNHGPFRSGLDKTAEQPRHCTCQ